MSIWNPKTWFGGPRQEQRSVSTSSPSYQRELDSYWKKIDRGQRLERALQESFQWGGYPQGLDIAPLFSQFLDGQQFVIPIFPLFPSIYQAESGTSYIYITQSLNDIIRTYSRICYETIPYADGALNLVANMSIGRGFEYNVCLKKRIAKRKYEGLTKLCNRVLEDFLNENDWWTKERDAFINCHRDGNYFLRFFPQEDGITRVREIGAEYVRSVSGDPNWCFGILTEQGDLERAIAYSVWYSNSPDQYEEVPAEEIIHFKNRFTTQAKIGISTFFNTGELFRDASNLQRAGRLGESARQAISYIRQWQQATAGTIQSLQGQQENETLQVPTGGTPLTENIQRILPGSVEDVPEGMEHKDPPNGHGENAKLHLDETLRQIAVKMQLPQWALTADSGSTNYAASLTAESPAVKGFEYHQHLSSRRYIKVMKKVLQIAVDQGLLPQNTLEVIDVNAEGQPIQSRNLKEEALIDEMLVKNKALSRRSMTTRAGYDFDEEMEYREQDGDDEIEAMEQEMQGKEDSSTPGAQYQRETGSRA